MYIYTYITCILYTYITKCIDNPLRMEPRPPRLDMQTTNGEANVIVENGDANANQEDGDAPSLYYYYYYYYYHYYCYYYYY